MKKRNYKYATIKKSKVYHELRGEGARGGGHTKCELYFWGKELCYSKPKGKRLCKKCKRSH